jgi:hypothetical protein
VDVVEDVEKSSRLWAWPCEESGQVQNVGKERARARALPNVDV